MTEQLIDYEAVLAHEGLAPIEVGYDPDEDPKVRHMSDPAVSDELEAVVAATSDHVEPQVFNEAVRSAVATALGTLKYQDKRCVELTFGINSRDDGQPKRPFDIRQRLPSLRTGYRRPEDRVHFSLLTLRRDGSLISAVSAGLEGGEDDINRGLLVPANNVSPKEYVLRQEIAEWDASLTAHQAELDAAVLALLEGKHKDATEWGAKVPLITLNKNVDKASNELAVIHRIRADAADKFQELTGKPFDNPQTEEGEAPNQPEERYIQDYDLAFKLALKEDGLRDEASVQIAEILEKTATLVRIASQQVEQEHAEELRRQTPEYKAAQEARNQEELANIERRKQRERDVSNYRAMARRIDAGREREEPGSVGTPEFADSRPGSGRIKSASHFIGRVASGDAYVVYDLGTPRGTFRAYREAKDKPYRGLGVDVISIGRDARGRLQHPSSVLSWGGPQAVSSLTADGYAMLAQALSPEGSDEQLPPALQAFRLAIEHGYVDEAPACEAFMPPEVRISDFDDHSILEDPTLQERAAQAQDFPDTQAWKDHWHQKRSDSYIAETKQLIAKREAREAEARARHTG